MASNTTDDSPDFPLDPKNEEHLIPSATTWTEKDANEYNIENRQNGHWRCLIFYHEKFNNEYLKERKGAEKDNELMALLFTSIGFKVSSYKDKTIKEIKNIIKDEAEQKIENRGCFVCCISTHGFEGHLHAKDGKYPLRHIYEPFYADRCTSLAGKPKLFFIQACHGEKLDGGQSVRTSETDGDIRFKICTYADVLMALSSQPGYASFTTPAGSPFIKSIYEIFSKYRHEKDVMSMLTMVNAKVCIEYESKNSSEPDKHGKKQVSCIISTLTRDLYLR